MSKKVNFEDIKNHIMSGFSGMLPLIVVGAIGMSLGRFYTSEGVLGELFAFLNEVGLNKFDIVVAMLIANSISPRVGLISGFMLGYYSNSLSLGIFGAIVVGLLAGCIGLMFNKIKLSGSNKALVSMIVVPIISSIVGFFVVKYVVAAPITLFQSSLIGFLNNVSTTSSILLAVILGLMLGFDLGGPINKTAAIFTVISLSEGVRGPFTYATAIFMLHSMAVGTATLLDRKRVLFDEDEHVQAPSILGLSMLSLSEPALPMMFSDMKFMVPVNMFCSALLAALYAFFGLETSLAIGVVGFVFMNKPLVALISYLTVLTIHVSLILFRRKQLNSIG